MRLGVSLRNLREVLLAKIATLALQVVFDVADVDFLQVRRGRGHEGSVMVEGTSPAAMSSRSTRWRTKLFSGNVHSALGAQLWLPGDYFRLWTPSSWWP